MENSLDVVKLSAVLRLCKWKHVLWFHVTRHQIRISVFYICKRCFNLEVFWPFFRPPSKTDQYTGEYRHSLHRPQFAGPLAAMAAFASVLPTVISLTYTHWYLKMKDVIKARIALPFRHLILQISICGHYIWLLANEGQIMAAFLELNFASTCCH